jgi:hypothetical protein
VDEEIGFLGTLTSVDGGPSGIGAKTRTVATTGWLLVWFFSISATLGTKIPNAKKINEVPKPIRVFNWFSYFVGGYDRLLIFAVI